MMMRQNPKEIDPTQTLARVLPYAQATPQELYITATLHFANKSLI